MEGHGAALGKERMPYAEELLVLQAGTCPDASLEIAHLEPQVTPCPCCTG